MILSTCVLGYNYEKLEVENLMAMIQKERDNALIDGNFIALIIQIDIHLIILETPWP